MKIKKLTAKIVCIWMLFSIFSMNFSAAGAVETSEKPLSANWQYMFDAFFAGNGDAKFSNGEDATEYMLSHFSSMYQMKDYNGILEECKKAEIEEINASEDSNASSSEKSILQMTYKKYSSHLFTKPDLPFPGKTWYVLVTVSGTYTYQDSSDTIVSFPKPSSVVVDYSDAGAGFYFSTISKTTTTPSIGTTGNYATFQVTTRYSVTFSYDSYNLGTIGTYTDIAGFRVST